MQKVRWNRVAAIVLLVACCGALSAWAGKRVSGPEVVVEAVGMLELDEFGEADEREQVAPGFKQREAEVESALSSLPPGHRWAGSYYHGDGLGANVRLTLAPDAGAVATWHGCLGLYDADYGAVTLQPGGELAIAFQGDNDPDGIGFAERLVPVSWGERQYLIEPDRLTEFASDINHGLEPRTGSGGTYLLREGDAEKPVEGLPDLPPHALRLIRSEPLDLVVKAVEVLPDNQHGTYCTERYLLRFPRTELDGLEPGLELRRTKGWDFHTARVVSVDTESAVAEVSELMDACDVEGGPRVGWVYSTGSYPPVPDEEDFDCEEAAE